MADSIKQPSDSRTGSVQPGDIDNFDAIVIGAAVSGLANGWFIGGNIPGKVRNISA
jgi:hypothetical protein